MNIKPPKDAYCGAKKVPKNRRRGTMKECADMRQVRFYGINKADPRVIETAKRVKKPETRSQLLTKAMKAYLKIKKLNVESARKETTAERKKEIEKQIAKLREELSKIEERKIALEKQQGLRK